MIINVNLPEQEFEEFRTKCYLDGTTPAEVLGGFIADLLDGIGTRGSDERRLANEYYDRCGYCAPRETFVHFLLSHYGREALEEVYQEEGTSAAAGYYDVYTEQAGTQVETLEEGIAEVIDFMEGGGRE